MFGSAEDYNSYMCETLTLPCHAYFSCVVGGGWVSTACSANMLEPSA